MSDQWIKVRGARENNLKSIDIDIPKNKLVVMTGLSGSENLHLLLTFIITCCIRRSLAPASTTSILNITDVVLRQGYTYLKA